MSYDLAVVGGGPAGLSAAIQARTRNKTVVVISGDHRDSPLYKAERIDNYLGLPGLTGRALLERLEEHAQAMGVARREGRALNILSMNGTFYIGVGSDMEQARAVVLATGVSHGAKYPGEAEFLGKGVSYCATCDGMLYRNKQVAVVGKSAEAPQEANYLAGLGCQVTYVAAKEPQGLAEDILFRRGTRLSVGGEGRADTLVIDGEPLRCDGVFILRASVAPTDLAPTLALEGGYVAVDRSMSTNLPGIFAAGDCTGLPLQVSKAVGEGQIAGHRAAEYIDKLSQ